MTARSITLILLATTAFSTACEGNRPTETAQPDPIDQPEPDPSVLTTLEVLPGSVTLEWGSSVQLEIVARDQRGARIATAVTFSSSDLSIARVSARGLVTGVGAGTADIVVLNTIAGVTRSASMKATISPVTPSASLMLTADFLAGWQPSAAHLSIGGTVLWWTDGPLSWAGVPHRMLYVYDDKQYAVTDSLDLSSGSSSLKFLTAGKYFYCSAGCWDPPDWGIVYVH